MKILIADDHALIRAGLKHALADLDKNLIILEAECGSSVLSVVNKNDDLDIVILDLSMPKTTGFDLLIKLCNTMPEIPVVVLSALDEYKNMRKAMDCGASGFIPKSTPYDVMVNAIKLVLSGGVYIPPNILRQNKSKKAAVSVDNSISAENTEQLTARQKEVLELMIKGCQNKVIAHTLGLSEHTIKVHVAAVLRTLGVSNRTQAVIAAQKFLKSPI